VGPRVVVIGGGVTGLSTAYHLARAGVRDVLLLEREQLASGSTGRSAGGIRLQFSDAVNITLAKRSVAVFERFSQEFGAECDFRQYGYLLLATTEDEERLFRANVALQRSLDVPVEVLSPEEAGRMVPGLRTDDLRLATFCPKDGYADPYSVAMAFAAAARRLGVRILEGHPVTGIEVRGGRVTGVQVADGQTLRAIPADVVVNAAGPWAAQIGQMVGLELPITPYRRQVFVTGPFDALPQRLPMVIDFRPHFYFRREGPGILFGMTDLSEPPSFNTHVDWAFLEKVVERMLHRIPPLARASVRRGWAGLYDTTPDNNPILGRVPGLEGFVMAAGFSGHGFMLSPAIGECLAELITAGRCRTVDLSPLAIDRFLSGTLRREASVI
jgi:sarcosine oxidase subunit beta